MVLLSVSQNGAIARRNDGLEYYATLSVFGEQATGAMIGLCVMTLYMGRRYFWEVFKKGY